MEEALSTRKPGIHPIIAAAPPSFTIDKQSEEVGTLLKPSRPLGRVSRQQVNDGE
jgi:hypothetical protein